MKKRKGDHPHSTMNVIKEDSEWEKNIEHPRNLIPELCRNFYTLGWVSGTGGGISMKFGDKYYVAPSGVQKERIKGEDLFVLDAEGALLASPDASTEYRPSACTPLFFNAYNLHNSGAVLHSHSINTMLATLIFENEFIVTHLEMIKGIKGHGYHDKLIIPIIENTAHEAELRDSMLEAMKKYPKATAVLVRRHGVYVWGDDWKQAKAQAECYDYLFEAAVKMKQMGIDPSVAPIYCNDCTA